MLNRHSYNSHRASKEAGYCCCIRALSMKPLQTRAGRCRTTWWLCRSCGKHHAPAAKLILSKMHTQHVLHIVYSCVVTAHQPSPCDSHAPVLLAFAVDRDHLLATLNIQRGSCNVAAQTAWQHNSSNTTRRMLPSRTAALRSSLQATPSLVPASGEGVGWGGVLFVRYPGGGTPTYWPYTTQPSKPDCGGPEAIPHQ